MKTEGLFPIFLSITAVAVMSLISACKTNETETSAGEAALNEATNVADQAVEEGAEAAAETGNRFGYAGGDDAAEDAASDVREVREMTESERNAIEGSGTKEKEKLSDRVKANSASDAQPTAKKVPGDPLAVTLSGKHAALGPISIERYDSAGQPTGQALPSGTPVEIPDRNNPGQKILFKVP